MTLKEEIEKLSIKKHWFFTEKDSVTLAEYIRQREKELLKHEKNLLTRLLEMEKEGHHLPTVIKEQLLGDKYQELSND